VVKKLLEEARPFSPSIIMSIRGFLLNYFDERQAATAVKEWKEPLQLLLRAYPEALHTPFSASSDDRKKKFLTLLGGCRGVENFFSGDGEGNGMRTAQCMAPLMSFVRQLCVLPQLLEIFPGGVSQLLHLVLSKDTNSCCKEACCKEDLVNVIALLKINPEAAKVELLLAEQWRWLHDAVTGEASGVSQLACCIANDCDSVSSPDGLTRLKLSNGERWGLAVMGRARPLPAGRALVDGATYEAFTPVVSLMRPHSTSFPPGETAELEIWSSAVAEHHEGEKLQPSSPVQLWQYHNLVVLRREDKNADWQLMDAWRHSTLIKEGRVLVTVQLDSFSEYAVARKAVESWTTEEVNIHASRCTTAILALIVF